MLIGTPGNSQPAIWKQDYQIRYAGVEESQFRDTGRREISDQITRTFVVQSRLTIFLVSAQPGGIYVKSQNGAVFRVTFTSAFSSRPERLFQQRGRPQHDRFPGRICNSFRYTFTFLIHEKDRHLWSRSLSSVFAVTEQIPR
jgi:hypothetical protein